MEGRREERGSFVTCTHTLRGVRKLERTIVMRVVNILARIMEVERVCGAPMINFLKGDTSAFCKRCHPNVTTKSEALIGQNCYFSCVQLPSA